MYDCINLSDAVKSIADTLFQDSKLTVGYGKDLNDFVQSTITTSNDVFASIDSFELSGNVENRQLATVYKIRYILKKKFTIEEIETLIEISRDLELTIQNRTVNIDVYGNFQSEQGQDFITFYFTLELC